MISRVFLPIVYLAATVLIVSAACSSEPASATGSGEPSRTAQIGAAGLSRSPQSDPRFLAKDLPLLPTGIVMAVRPVEVMRASYEFAARHPEVMRYVPCFCGCEQGGHKDNHDCFVSSRSKDNKVTAWESHAVGCQVCVDVAYQSMQMHNSGASVSAIRDAIEKKYAGHPGGGHTPTPMPKRGGTSHD